MERRGKEGDKIYKGCGGTGLLVVVYSGVVSKEHVPASCHPNWFFECPRCFPISLQIPIWVRKTQTPQTQTV